MRTLIIFLLSFTLFSSFSIKAIEIAAITHEGPYAIINVNNFEISDVGDLRRFGFIYVNNAIPGSTYESAVIMAEFFKEPAPTDRGFNHSQLTLNKLTKLNHDRSYIPKGHTINLEDENYAQWVANDPQKRIILMSSEDKKTITTYNENLQKLEQTQLNLNHQAYNALSCTNKTEDILMIGWKDLLLLKKEKDNTIIKKQSLAEPQLNLRATDIAEDCYVVMTLEHSQNQPITIRVINLATNIVQKPFTTNGYGEYNLYNDGQLLLKQLLNATSIPNTPAIKTLPTENFVLYNTQTGEKVKEFKIPNQNATLKKVVKTDKGYIAILGGPQNIQFVSLETFKSLKTIKLPFKRFFVI